MSRLLFAAARGARILNNKGKPVKYVWVWPEIAIPDFGVHIHPDDAHLEYGLISTALRKTSQEDINYLQDSTGVYEQAAIQDYETNNELGFCWDYAANTTSMHKSLFLLILAECLADEGL